MKLDGKSRLVRFAYWMDRPKDTGKYLVSTGDVVTLEQLCAMEPYEPGERYYTNIPRRTSLCRFFWRAFVLVPIASPFVVVVMGVMWVLGGAYALLTSIPRPDVDLGVGEWIDRTGDRLSRVMFAVQESTFVAFFKAAKARMCPIIEFENRG